MHIVTFKERPGDVEMQAMMYDAENPDVIEKAYLYLSQTKSEVKIFSATEIEVEIKVSILPAGEKIPLGKINGL